MKLSSLVKTYGLQKVNEKIKVPYDTLRKLKDFKFDSSQKRGRPIKYPEVENQIKYWILEQR